MAAHSAIVQYLFSGTGNSRNVARWFSNTAIERGAECKTIDIAQTNRKKIEAPGSNALIVFISPVHGFNYPPVMLHYILRFPRGKNRVVLMNTRAGMLLGKWVTPGLTGIAFYLSALILTLKGYSVQGMYPVDLPSNWTSLHPGLNDRTIRYLHGKCKERVNKFANTILDGKKDFRCVREIVQDLLVSPIAILYYFIGRYVIAKTNFVSRACNNCGICLQNCPVKAIILVDHRPFWTYRCESCMKCMGNCPKKAIESSHGFFIGFLFLLNSVLLVLFYKYFNHYFFAIENEGLRMVIEAILTLLLMALVYRVVHYLMHFRFFERIIVYTSLTRFRFWGKRYKAPKEK